MNRDKTQRILVVDDAADVRLLIQRALEAEGFEVWVAADADAAEALIEDKGLPHLVVLDILMPGRDGLQLGRDLLEYTDLPIIFLSAVDDDETIVAAIEEIAEDYVTKPFSPQELVARVKRVLRRIPGYGYTLPPVVPLGHGVAVDFARQQLEIDGEGTVSLTPTETKILHILHRSAPRTVTNDYLLRRIWPEGNVFEDALRVHVHRLRQKLGAGDEAGKDLVLTERGKGYRMEAAE